MPTGIVTTAKAWVEKNVLHPMTNEARILLDILAVRAPTALSGAGAVSPGSITMFTSTGAGNALTLADGQYLGQCTKVIHKVKGSSGTGVITPTHFNHTSITLTNVNEGVEFLWDGTNWLLAEMTLTPTVTG